MIKNRQLHLWVGLLASILILIEAVTGLIMSEPWLIGAGKPSKQHVETSRPSTGEWENETHFDGEASQGTDFKNTGNANSLMGFVRGLHTGRIGNTDISFFLDIIAVCLIILTTTGIILSSQVLRAQSIRKKIKTK